VNAHPDRPDHLDDLLSARLDDELDPATARAVDQHLQECSTCRHELLEVDEARRALRVAPPVDAPAELVDDFVRRRHRAERRGGIVAVLAAAVALVAGVASVDAASVGGAKAERIDRAEAAERPSIRRANGTSSPEPSLADRVAEAARDLLDFLG
jgi:anti-sigma factor RsiW